MTAESSLQQRFGLTVTPQNVLGVRAVVLQEAQDLDALLENEGKSAMLPHLGTDPVSRDMSEAFNAVTTQLVNRALEHVAALFALGEELGATARAYGHLEADIKASLEDQSASAASRLSVPFRQFAGMSATVTQPSSMTLGGLMSGGQR